MWIETDHGTINLDTVTKIVVIDTLISFFCTTGNSNPTITLDSHDAALRAYQMLISKLDLICKDDLHGR